MKKIIAFFLGILLMGHVAQAADPSITFVNNLTDKIITDVLTSNVSDEQKLATFKTEFQQALDLKAIGQFVLGVYWRSATPADRDAFLAAFMDFTTKSWAGRFNMYNGQKIVFTGTRNAQKNQLYVDSQIQHNPPVEVIWRLREKDGDFKIVDIIVEGVSMAMSYRNEYSAFLQQNGGNLPALTAELNKKAAAFKLNETTK